MYTTTSTVEHVQCWPNGSSLIVRIYWEYQLCTIMHDALIMTKLKLDNLEYCIPALAVQYYTVVKNGI